MSGSINLPFWPSTLDCVKWSEDNRIIVAGSESIAIISPRFKDFEPGKNQWNTAVLPVTGFTAEEVPRREPLHVAHFSVGEEVGNWQVEAVAWSALRLSHHRGCALAVLTSNHVLSIWTSDGDATERETWKRRLVVNKSLRAFYDGVDVDTRSRISQPVSRQDFVQVAQRVRSFAWVPVEHDSRPCLGEAIKRGAQLLVVTTEAGDILCLRIERNSDRSFATNQTWSSTITSVYQVGTRTRPSPALKSVRLLAGEQSMIGFATHVSCGPWTTPDGSLATAPLLYLCDGQLHKVILNSKPGQPWLDADLVADKTATAWRCPERTGFTSLLQSNAYETLQWIAAVSANRIDMMTANKTYSHSLDDRWDEVSGCTVATRGTDDMQTDVVFHLSTMKKPALSINWPSTSDKTTNPSRRWWTAIEATRQAFSTEYGLDNKTVERVWGMASSPFGGFTATCASIHLATFPAYVIPSDRVAALNISREDSSDVADSLSCDRQSGLLPSASVMFVLQQHLRPPDELGVESDPDIEYLTKQALNMLFRSSYPFERLKDESLSAQASNLRNQFFMPVEVREQRARRLAELVAQKGAPRNQISRVIVQQLVDQVLALSSGCQKIEAISSRIEHLYRTIQAKLAETDPSIVSRSGNFVHEECATCHRPIAFESLKWARCDNDHLFTRCALSFLAIQGADFAKSCALCDVQYIDAALHPEIASALSQDNVDTDLNGTVVGHGNANAKLPIAEPEEVSHTTNTTSLAQLIFTAFDTCIYCGGTFIS